MDREKEIDLLKEECLTRKGKPRKNCDLEKLRRLIELKAETPDAPVVEDAPDNIKQLEGEYNGLVAKLFDRTGPEIKLKEGATAKELARFYELKDMIRQPLPKSDRISAKVLPDKSIEVKVSKGPPVTLEGKNEIGWHTLARIMPDGGRIVTKKKYEAFRIIRGTDQPQYITLRTSTSNPNRNRKQNKKAKPRFEL